MARNNAENTFEFHKEEYNEIFNRDESIVDKLIALFNEKGHDVTDNEFNQIVKTEIKSYIGTLILSLASLSHTIKFHKQDLEDISNSGLDTKVIKGILTFVEGLNEKAKNDLNLIYNAYHFEEAETEKVIGVNDDLFFKRVYEHNEETVGLLPMIRVVLDVERDGEIKQEKYNFSLHRLGFFANTFQRMYERNQKYIETYKSEKDNNVMSRSLE